MKKRRHVVIGAVFAASLAQGLLYPTIAYGLDSDAPDPISDSSVTYHDDGSVRVPNAPNDEDASDPTDESSSGDGDATTSPEDISGNGAADKDAAPTPVPSSPDVATDGAGAGENVQSAPGEEPESSDNVTQAPEQQQSSQDEDGTGKAEEIRPPSEDYTGRFDYQGATYYFKQGQMVKNAEVHESGNWYRYDADGKMHKGVYAEDGKRYFYDIENGHRVSGVWNMFNEDGQGTRWVYYSTADGTMQFGEQYLDYDRDHTGWYYFDTHTGKMAHGFTWLPAHGNDAAKTVYYHAQTGKMQYGGQLINQRPYFFDKTTGRKYSGNEVVNTLVRTAKNFCHSNLNASQALVGAGGIFCPQGPCMSFVWCVYHYSGMDVFLANGTSAAGRPSGYPDAYYTWFANNGRLTHTPRVGDVAFFYFPNGAGWSTNASHAAFVVGVNGNKVTVIDAAFYNIAERVASNSGGTYPLPKAYGHPDFQ